MEQEDYLMREIEKITRLLKDLLSKVSFLNPDNFTSVIKYSDDVLTGMFDFSADTVKDLDKSEFLKKIEKTDYSNIELLAELFLKLSYKITENKKDNEYNVSELLDKAMFMTELIDTKTKTFSLKRTNLKNEILKLKDIITVEENKQ